jgi:hypothetical protein
MAGGDSPEEIGERSRPISSDGHAKEGGADLSRQSDAILD